MKFSQLFRGERRFDNAEAQYMQLKHDIKHMRLVLCVRVTFVFHLNISFFQDWDGQVELATQLLGHHFEVRGVVVRGDQRGRTIGFPTANIEVPKAICIPADGVYAGVLTRNDGMKNICAINLGRRPTFFEHADHSMLEAHLLDFSADLYGEKVKLTFTHFLRGERKFENIDALKMQLKLDIEQTRAVSSR